MNHDTVPSQRDCLKLRRAVVGFLLLIVAQVVTGFAVQFDGSNLIADGLFCLLYCAGPVLGIVAVWRSPFPPPDDATRERYLKAAVHGRRGCFWLGVACVTTGIVLFPLMDFQTFSISAWFVASGLLFVCWSFQFPKIVVPDEQPARRWQFSLRTILVITAIAGLYMGAVLLCSEPDDSVIWRLSKPLVAIGALCFLISLFVMLVVAPIRVVWVIATKVFTRRTPKADS